MKIQAEEVKKPIVAIGYVSSVEPSKISKNGKGQYMVTTFTVAGHGPAGREMFRDANVYVTWLPSWFRPNFDERALKAQLEEYKTNAEAGDEDAKALAKELSAALFVAETNFTAPKREKTSTMRGLVGGASYAENEELFDNGLFAAMNAIGEKYPESEDKVEEETNQTAIVTEIDALFQSFFGPEGKGGKLVGFRYGHANEKVKDAAGNPVLTEEGRVQYAPSKYRSILDWFTPDPSKLERLKASCAKNGKSTFMIDLEQPY